MKGKMVVIYQTPKDKAAFDRHYLDVHIPLAKKLPGLRKYELSSENTILSPTGHSNAYMVATLYFDSLEAIKASFATPEGQACAADRKILVPDSAMVQIYLYESLEV
jgi:uncharacterized protein (TIGR02118 family)